jgi:hypothetical protein
MNRQVNLRMLFWLTAIVSLFLAAWTFLPMASNNRRFWLSWSIVCVDVLAIHTAGWIWQRLDPRN